ncbi:hypothetical protein SLOPH_1103 [Spraguea lophii 42_110]|uniref:Uncharacterized protein n=1 Tax=Spraguea lophii (strain 42_110) TaxID=1358809 RepID=S7W9W0_SPRLO|nr:hypothetical protein SLOPH_1103 [Spraguea lophii 42_110]
MSYFSYIHKLWFICSELHLHASVRYSSIILYHLYNCNKVKFKDYEIMGASILMCVKLYEIDCSLNNIITIIANLEDIDILRLKEKIVYVEMHMWKKYGFFIHVDNGYKILKRYLVKREIELYNQCDMYKDNECDINVSDLKDRNNNTNDDIDITMNNVIASKHTDNHYTTSKRIKHMNSINNMNNTDEYNKNIIMIFNDLICCKYVINFTVKEVIAIAIKIYYKEKYNIKYSYTENKIMEDNLLKERDMLLIWSKGKDKDVGVEKNVLIDFFKRQKNSR